MNTQDKIKLISVLNTSLKNGNNSEFTKQVREKIIKLMNSIK